MSNYKYTLVCLIAAIFSIWIYELTLWISGELLGYKMIMTLKSGWPAKGFYDAHRHYTLCYCVGILWLSDKYNIPTAVESLKPSIFHGIKSK